MLTRWPFPSTANAGLEWLAPSPATTPSWSSPPTTLRPRRCRKSSWACWSGVSRNTGHHRLARVLNRFGDTAAVPRGVGPFGPRRRLRASSAGRQPGRRRHFCLPGRDSELLISWNLGRPKFVDQPEIRAGKDSFRGGEFLTQVTNRGVVGRLRQMMQTDRQRLGSEIGNQIDLGVVDLPQKSARIVGAFQLFADGGSHAGFRAIRDHFDGVEEVLSLGAQARETVCFRQFLNRDLAGRLFAPLLELIQGRLELLDAFLQFSLMLLVMADRRFRQGLSEAHILLQFLKALPLCMLFADLAIQFSPRRVEHGHSSRNFFGSVLHKSI